jgi:hypothetical protein
VFEILSWILATSARMTAGAVAVLYPPVIAALVAAIHVFVSGRLRAMSRDSP